jgi:hypothetical protein
MQLPGKLRGKQPVRSSNHRLATSDGQLEPLLQDTGEVHCGTGRGQQQAVLLTHLVLQVQAEVIDLDRKPDLRPSIPIFTDFRSTQSSHFEDGEH